ncbi:NADH:ubiquinone oxidoreductase, membrane subunit H [Candidatus Zixiibacteriota bacterium]|nr:NADH:ubiquinone oxidoreductase, membrane subunit H [candidate division Zixibacteria bacterium]
MELTNIFKFLYEKLAASGLPQTLVDLIALIAAAFIVFGFLAVVALFLVWWERKISAHIQQRFGPMRTGWHGWIQTIVDMLKLLQKEDITPAAADRPVFYWAPIVALTAAFAAYVVIPFGKGLIVSDLNIGILFIVGITTFTIISLLMAGWGSNNKYALLGGMRSAAQVVSYEVPMVVAILSIVVFAGSMSMMDIVNSQAKIYEWYIFRLPFGPIAFIIYLIAGTAETNRTPFDLPEAEQELVAGFNVEYSGMKFAMFFFAEFVNLFTVSAIATTLFLGGWQGPFLPSWIWFLIKSMAMVFVLMWFRWTFPRLRVDQLMEFSWKFLLPLSFVNLIIAGLMKYSKWFNW